jgi:hypothetical protein
MEALNFKVEASRHLVVEGMALDLHNCYDFRSYKFDVASRELVLAWSRSKEYGKPTDPKIVALCVSAVDYLRVEPRDASLPFAEDSCLSVIGYAYDQSCPTGTFWTDEPPDPSWTWVFEFQSGASIAIRGQNVRASTEP